MENIQNQEIDTTAKEEKFEKKHGISTKMRLFFGVGDFSATFISSMETYYFQYFLTDVAKYSLKVVTFILTLGRLINCCVSWTYGIIMDIVPARKWGRYRSWLIMLPWIVPVLIPFMYSRIGPTPLAIAIVIIAYVTNKFCYNIPFTANMTMINVAADNADERAALTSSRTTWATISRIVYSYVGPGLVSLITVWLGERWGYFGAAFAFGCLFAAGYLAHFVLFKGYEAPGETDIEKIKAERAAKKAQKKNEPGLWDAIKVNPYLIVAIIIVTIGTTGVLTVSSFAAYYFKYVALNSSLTSVYLLIGNIAAVFVGILSKAMISKLSTKYSLIIFYGAGAAALIIAYFFRFNTWVVLIAMCILLCCVTGNQGCMPVIFGECGIYSEYKTGKNYTGAIVGLSNISINVSILLMGVVSTGVLAWAGYDANILPENTSQTVVNGIATGITLAPAAILVVALLIVLFGYRLTSRKLAEYQNEINARKAA